MDYKRRQEAAAAPRAGRSIAGDTSHVATKLQHANFPGAFPKLRTNAPDVTMAAVGTPSQQQPPPRAPGFPYPTTLFIHKPNVLHLELRGVRFDVDINILRLFPESVLVGMFSGAGGNAPGGGAQAYPLLALLQSRTSGDGLSGGLSALVGTYARPGQPLGSSGILVPAVSGSPPGSPAQGSRGSAAAPAGEKGQSASDSKPPSPKAASSDASRGPVFVPPSASKKTATAMRWQRFYTADEVGCGSSLSILFWLTRRRAAAR